MSLAFDDRGGGDPLVLIHGLGTTRWIWRETTASLAQGRRVIALDLPGFGDSPPLGPKFDLETVADAVAEEAGDRAGGPFDLLGHSLGGALALTAARRRQDRIRRLILHAPAGFRPRSDLLAQAVAAAAPVAIRARRLFGAPLVQNQLARRALLWGAIHDPGRLSTEQARAMLEASRGARHLREAAEVAIAADLADDLEAIELPVGFVWGDRDPLMPRATQELLRARRPEAPVRVISDAGHVAQLERPEAFAEAVARLLGSLGKPVPARAL
jgi:pimeloyl-ACP methyl ester carboxylesterase